MKIAQKTPVEQYLSELRFHGLATYTAEEVDNFTETVEELTRETLTTKGYIEGHVPFCPTITQVLPEFVNLAGCRCIEAIEAQRPFSSEHVRERIGVTPDDLVDHDGEQLVALSPDTVRIVYAQREMLAAVDVSPGTYARRAELAAA